MNNFDYKKEWLADFKIQIRYPYSDQDNHFVDLISIAHDNILKQYMELEQDYIDDPNNLIFLTQTKIKLATFNLANSYNENPDILIIAEGNVQSNRQIYNILGDLVKYLK